MDKKIDILVTGVGGQGTVLLSKLIASASIQAGLFVRTTETIGMAQRGGSVVSHIRIGSEAASVHSPLIPLACADLLLSMEPAEAVRMLPYLKQHGRLIVCDRPVQPSIGLPYAPKMMTDYMKQMRVSTTLLNVSDLIRACGTSKPLNMALLGTALNSGLLPFNEQAAVNALSKLIMPNFFEINQTAIQVGKEAGYENE